MTQFTEWQLSLENYWRSIIRFGRNVASFKFALGNSLLELAQQTTSRSSRFLDPCRVFNAGELTLEELVDATSKLGFANVIDAFPFVRRKDEEKFNGDYRTKRVILEICDAMQDSIRTGNPYQTRHRPIPELHIQLSRSEQFHSTQTGRALE